MNGAAEWDSAGVERESLGWIRALLPKARGGLAALTRPGISKAALVLCVLAYGLYVTGVNVARRDVYLDGMLLYGARLVQMAAFLACAVLFRNHLPSTRRLMVVASVVLGLHFGLEALGFLTGGSPWFAWLGHGLSGVANALFVLLLAHFFSTYGPATSSVAVAVAFLLKEILFAWTALWTPEFVVAAQIWMRVCAVAALVAASRLKAGVEPTAEEHPLQYGVSLVKGPEGHPMAYLVNGADWVYQIILAALTPFIFGFVSQMLSTGPLSDGLHDITSEVWAVVALVVIVGVSAWRGTRLSFADMLVPTILLNTLGLVLLPLLWGGPATVGPAFLKCAGVVNECLLWILLAHKAFGDPRHTYLYFGAFLTIWNVTYGRLAAPFILGGAPVDYWLVSTVSLVFLGAIVLVCLLLFGLQRAGLVPSRAMGEASGEEAATGETDLPFARGIAELCSEHHVTAREREILVKALHGYSMPNIAAQLGISPETVRTHMRNIYQKVGVSNKQELIRLVDARNI